MEESYSVRLRKGGVLMKLLINGNIEIPKNDMSKFKKWVSTATIILSWTLFAISMMGACNVLPRKFAWSILAPIAGVISLLNGLAIIRRNKIAGIVILLCTVVIFVASIYIIKVEFFMLNRG